MASMPEPTQDADAARLAKIKARVEAAGRSTDVGLYRYHADGQWLAERLEQTQAELEACRRQLREARVVAATYGAPGRVLTSEAMRALGATSRRVFGDIVEATVLAGEAEVRAQTGGQIDGR